MRTPADPAALLRAIMRNNLAAFVERVFRTVEPTKDFQRADYIDLVADALEAVASGDGRRLIINVPPRHLKSILASVAFVAWTLGHDPGARFVLVSYGSDVVERHMRQIRLILKSDWYRKLFPRTIISPRKDTASEFETTAGGSVFATTIEGVLTGRGGDYFIIDDPIKAGDATYASRLKAVNDWIRQSLLSRQDDKSTGRVVVVMQRLHLDDLSGELLRSGGWDHLCLPAIAERDEVYRLRDGRSITRKEGEALSERENLQVLADIRREIGSAAFSAQYQQRPRPMEGNQLRAEWLQYYEALPEQHPYDRVVQAWDLGVKDGNFNDYSACVTVKRSHRDKKFYVLHIWRGRKLYPELKAKITQMAEAHKPRQILIEDAGLGPAMVVELKRAGLTGVREVKPKGSKTDRIAAQSTLLEAGEVFFPKHANWMADFEDEYRAFPAGSHDDMLDALAYALAAARRASVAEALEGWNPGEFRRYPPRETV